MWGEKMKKCRSEEDSLQMACCKNEGVPYNCGGYCWAHSEEGPCEEWIQKIEECMDGNEGKMCCKEKGVPEDCSYYCDSA